jgi:ABC-type phosphate transport system permease subunit
VEASASTVSGGRSLERSPASRLPDQLLKWGLTTLAVLILALLAYFFIRLIGQSQLAFGRFGVSFVLGNDWDPSRSIYHGAALLVGTLITSAIALLIGVPIAISAAIFLTELCPRRIRGPLTMLVDLLAAVPSVVYGLWGVYVLIPPSPSSRSSAAGRPPGPTTSSPG